MAIDAAPDRKVLVDCDPGWDDALALLLLLAKPGGPDVLGVTTVYGNDTLEETTKNARRLTAFCNKPTLFVFKGSGQPLEGTPPSSAALRSNVLKAMSDMGKLGARIATDLIVNAAQIHGQSLTILATGPLTNIANAIEKSTDMEKIGTLVVVGGALIDAPTDEFNLTADPTGTEMTLRAELNTVLIPFETCQQVTNADFLSTMKNMKTPFADFYVKVVEDQVQQGNREAADGLYDAVGALYVLHPALFTLIPQKVHIDFSEGKKGRIVPDPTGWSVSIAKIIDVAAAYSLLRNRLL